MSWVGLPHTLEKPFGPSIGHFTIPAEVVEDLNSTLDAITANSGEAANRDWSRFLVGKVRHQILIPKAVFSRHGEWFLQAVATYLHSVWPQNLGNHYRVQFVSGWYVRQFAGDWNPNHVHVHCDLSGVGYLQVPNWSDNAAEESNPHYRCAGNIEWTFGTPTKFSLHNYSIRPKAGDFYLFPATLIHCVYPFQSPGERRSFALNIIASPSPSESTAPNSEDVPLSDRYSITFSDP